MLAIETPRLRLVPGTRAMLQAELESPSALAVLLGAHVPPTWPPELYDAEAVSYILGWLDAHQGEARWGFYYILETAAGGVDVRDAQPMVIGAGGYKGAPDPSGAVEIGYSIVPECRRRGYAREAVDGWLAHAFVDGRVTRVLAHTLAELEPSIAVLRSAGFTFAGPGSDPQEPSAVQYVLTREAYEGSSGRHAVRILLDEEKR